MRDPVLRLAHVLPAWRAAFPQLQLVTLPRAGHFVPEDAPEEIVAAISRASDILDSQQPHHRSDKDYAG